MSARIRYAALLSLLGIAGCGGPTLDATSTQTYDASVKAMTANMSDAQKRQFAQDISAALGPEAALENAKKAVSKDGAATNPAAVYKPLHGMTVDAIQARARENREKMKKH